MRRRRQGRDWAHVYVTSVAVPGYPDRVVTIEVGRANPDHPRVYADGPSDSPHRYAERGRQRLCLWYPSDPPEQRWIPEDGLLSLFAMATQHLFMEAWWRENDREWLGAEAPHGPPGITLGTISGAAPSKPGAAEETA